MSVSWPSSQKQEKSQKSNTIFVGNLSYRATEKGIEDFFSDCGKVVSVRVAFEYDGRVSFKIIISYYIRVKDFAMLILTQKKQSLQLLIIKTENCLRREKSG